MCRTASHTPCDPPNHTPCDAPSKPPVTPPSGPPATIHSMLPRQHMLIVCLIQALQSSKSLQDVRMLSVCYLLACLQNMQHPVCAGSISCLVECGA